MSWLKANWNVICFWSAPTNYAPIMQNISPMIDSYRKTVGVSLLQQSLRKMSDYHRKNNKNIDKLNAIDIGCGTGNYIKILNSLKGTILPINIIGVDTNVEALDLGQHKMKEFGHKNIVWEHKDGLEMLRSLEDNSQHYIVINQVLHEMIDDDMDYTKVKDVIGECYRVLSDVGVLYINHSNAEQIKALWYSEYIPNGISKVIGKYVETDWIINEMLDNGFIDDGIVTQKIKEPLIETIYSMNFDFVKDPNWKYIDTIWNYVDENEYNECIKQINCMSDEERYNVGKISRNAMMNVGSSTTIIGIKNFDLYREWIESNNQ